jgi:integrase/recombinase XerD
MNKTNKTNRLQLYNEYYIQETIHYKKELQALGYHLFTCRLRQATLKEFFCFLEEIAVYKLQDINPKDINNYHEYIQNRTSTIDGQKLKNQTIKNHMRCIQKYLANAMHTGKIKTNPASSFAFKYPKEQVERIIFSQEQIQELYTVSNTMERNILNIGYGCGLRVGEIEKLELKDIKWDENLIIIEKGKNNKRRIIPINERIKNELQHFVKTTNNTNNQALFINIENRGMREWSFNRILKELVLKTNFGCKYSTAKIKQISFHSLRHSIATHLLQNGMKIEQIQYFLGHSSIESTQIYTHINQKQINQITNY